MFHAAIGEDEAGHALRGEARRMLKSEFRMANGAAGEVGVALGRDGANAES